MNPATQTGAPEQLKELLCGSFTLDKTGRGEWLLSSPFLFRDGDSFPLYLRRVPDGWVLSDDGAAVGRLFYDEFELNEARLRSLDAVAAASDLTVDANALVRRLAEFPTPYDIADVLLAMAQVTALPLLRTEPGDRGFRHQAVAAVSDILAHEQRRVLNWFPPEHGSLWPVDLWLPTAGHSVAAFFVGNTGRADRAALTISEFRRWGRDEVHLVGYKRQAVASQSIYRLQEVTEDDGAVIPLDLRGGVSGLSGFRRALSERGVAVLAA